MSNAHENIAEQIADFFFDLEGPGEFSVAGVAGELPSYPGMHVEGLGIPGPVPLPVNAAVAESLKAVAREAPFGKGFDTVVDPSVRKAWEINADKIIIAHSRWPEAIQSLTNRAMTELLGFKGAVVKPVLYKALLYETGGHFKPHRDSEKEKHMFATLVIQLPSVCTGGTLSTKHRNEVKVAQFGQDSGNACYKAHYAAFYADVEHCLAPVTSGYRLSLVYSLCWQSPEIALPSLSISCIDKILPVLANWSTISEQYKGPIGIVLEHWYSFDYLSDGTNILKGRDLVVTNVVESCNKRLPPDCKLRVVLADIRRNVQESKTWNQYDSDSDWEQVGSSTDINELYDLEGRERARAFDLDSTLLIDMKNGEIIDKDDDEFWGDAVDGESFTGNCAPTRDTVYEQQILLIYPTKFEFDQILKFDGLDKGATSLLSSIKRLEQGTTSQDITHEHHLADWETLLSRWSEGFHASQSTADLILKITMQWNRKDLALRVLEKLEEMARKTPENFAHTIDFITLVQFFGWASLSYKMRALIPLFPERYSIVSNLLNANSFQKDDPLVLLLHDNWSSSILEKNSKCPSIQQVWYIFCALEDDNCQETMAKTLRDDKVLHGFVFDLLGHLFGQNGPTQSPLVPILLDAFLEDGDSALYKGSPYQDQGRVPRMVGQAWILFERTKDPARQRVLAQTMTRAIRFDPLEDFIEVCLESQTTVENNSNLGIVLVHWLESFLVRQESGFPLDWPAGYDNKRWYQKTPPLRIREYERHFAEWNAKLAKPLPTPSQESPSVKRRRTDDIIELYD